MQLEDAPRDEKQTFYNTVVGSVCGEGVGIVNTEKGRRHIERQ